MNRYQQLTYEPRCQIYVLKTRGDSQRALTAAVGVSQSTVSRELSRNQGERGYRYQQTQAKAVQRRRAAIKAIKMTPERVVLIEAKRKEKWSPEQIAWHLLQGYGIVISHESSTGTLGAINVQAATSTAFSEGVGRHTQRAVTAKLAAAQSGTG